MCCRVTPKVAVAPQIPPPRASEVGLTVTTLTFANVMWLGELLAAPVAEDAV
jgi:hypothetical protein